jgi:uncharacterized protein YeaO (DUF488 family)
VLKILLVSTEKVQTMQVIKIKRVYDKPRKTDGYRILIDRLWPRGMTKEEAAIDEWAKELAPTDLLRNWFDHDPYYWEQFKRKYRAELKQNKLVQDFMERHKEKKLITLIYSTKYDKLTHALVLREHLQNMYCEI